VLGVFDAMATWAAAHGSACCGCALQGMALLGAAEYDSSNILVKSVLLERVCSFLLAVAASASASMSSAFRRPRLGRHSGRRARRARSSSGGMLSRSIRLSSGAGRSVM